MKILINATGSCQKDGFFSYITNLIDEINSNDQKNEYYIYSNGVIYEYLKKKNISNLVYKGNLFAKSCVRFLWMQIVLPFILWRYSIDILLSPLNTTPFILKLTKVKTFLVIHSNLPWLNSKLLPYGFFKAMVLRWLKTFSLFSSDFIISVSKNAKQELIKYAGINQDKITPILLGIDHNNFKNKTNTLMLRPHEFKYILYVANSAPHHNHLTLIDAFKTIASINEHHLILVMNNVDKKNSEKIINRIDKHGLSNRIIILPYLNSFDLTKYYTHCSLYLFPSLSETFGLTTIEAMACGAPVIASNCSAMPEINGDAALYFDPNDSYDIAQKAIYVLTKSEERSAMIQRGLARANLYNWEKTATKMIETLNAN